MLQEVMQYEHPWPYYVYVPLVLISVVAICYLLWLHLLNQTKRNRTVVPIHLILLVVGFVTIQGLLLAVIMNHETSDLWKAVGFLDVVSLVFVAVAVLFISVFHILRTRYVK